VRIRGKMRWRIRGVKVIVCTPYYYPPQHSPASKYPQTPPISKNGSDSDSFSQI
jgi:hypothetical protein